MRNVLKILVVCFVFSFMLMAWTPVYADHDEANIQPEKMNVVLSEKQKAELGHLYSDILAKRKEVIAKYVEYGILTEDKGKALASKLDKQYTKLEENGFVPQWDKHKMKHHH
jgi:hypothetical protein